MHIDIALRFKPFSHEPGAICLIPGTDWRVQAFPTRLWFFGPKGEKLEHRFSHCAVIQGFTLEQDLEKQEVRVFGQPKLDCRIAAGKVWENKRCVLELPVSAKSYERLERFSMGVHKAQVWEGIRQRLDLTEILPLWFHLGQMTPVQEIKERMGALAFLEECRNLRTAKEKVQLEKAFKQLFLVGFGRMFDPRAHDPEYRGIISETHEDPLSALALLKEGAELIRSLILTQKEHRWQLLPCLLSSFHAGRFKGNGIDLEWSNGRLKKAILRPLSDQEIILEWPSELQICRMRHNLKEKGRVLKRTEPLSLQKDQMVFLDRFEK